MYHTLKAACSSKIFDKVVLSTDIESLLEESETQWIRHKRFADLADHDTPMIRVVKDVLTRFSVPDQAWVWLLQPTSPFRVPADFKSILELTENKRLKSIISVSQVGDRHALRHYLIDNDHEIKRLINKPKLDAFCPRQKLRPAVERNGMFYVLKARTLRDHDVFDVSPCHGFEVPEERSRNINEPYDYELAQFEAERLRAKGIWL